MSTLSLDLRGVESTHAFPGEAPARSATVSLLLHGAFVSALVLTPLLQSTDPPAVMRTIAVPLARPIQVILPPARRPVSRAPHSNVPRRPLAAAASEPTPTQAPDPLIRIDLLDPDIGPGQRGQLGDAGDPFGQPAQGEECPLGSLCGPALQPMADPHPATVRIGGFIKEPSLLEGRAPLYPPLAQAAGVAGKVVLEARVGPDGRIREVRILQGHTLFDEAALASVRSRRYEALLLNGVPTEFLITITVAFNVRR